MGCSPSSEHPQGRGEDGHAPSTGPSSTSNPPGPDELQPPPLPPLAQEKSTAGAKAFVRYFVDTLNYAWESGSGSALSNLAASSCVVCKNVADGIDEVIRRGGDKEGGRWHTMALIPVPGQRVADAIINASIKIDPSRFTRSSNARVVQTPRRSTRFDFRLRWDGGVWRVADLSG